MADNTTLNPGTGGDTIATDDIAGVKHQMVKIEFGADGLVTSVSDTSPLPTKRSDIIATASVETSVAGSATSVTLLGPNTLRKCIKLRNDSSVALYLSHTPTATNQAPIVLQAQDLYEMQPAIYLGILTGIWDAATGFARIAEFT